MHGKRRKTAVRNCKAQRERERESSFAASPMAEGALEVETMSCPRSGGTGGGSGGGGPAREGMELPAQLDGQLELHVDDNRSDLLLVEPGSGGVQSAEEDGLVTEPVLGMRMLMSSRVSCAYATLYVYTPVHRLYNLV